ncbi:7TM diverse intracellular signaling domain-containing protein [Flavobacterium sp. J27]|uniref:sensor histidine kinase n=1 Tax=Flavobacterium sp. J27 TaxID=2060419 RepID=UPI00102F4FF5|nr:7TM diverse intracellular signaling domain-containing protein [Flavobacterium sp. J27]
MLKTTLTYICLLFIVVLGFSKEEPLSIQVSYLEDSKHILAIEDIIHLKFISVVDKSKLNFGFTKSNYWIKLDLKEVIPYARYKILVNTIINDSIEVYKKGLHTFEKTYLGEAFQSRNRYPTYFFLSENENCTIYFKIIGRDHPLMLPFQITKIEEAEQSNPDELIILGIVYGVIFLILLLNLVLFLNTLKRIYIYSMFFNVFSLAVLFYFDGIIKLYFFPNSLYWNNQSIAIAFCGSFIFTNYYIVEFLNLRQHKKIVTTYFALINCAFLFILLMSFWHPIGYNWYLKSNLVLTTVEVLLLFYSILCIRKKEKDYFYIQLVSVISLNVFGTITQCTFLGLLSINFLTNHSVHFVILPQILIQAFALGTRFSILIKQQVIMRKSLQESAQVYSQSLINTIEEERRRLSKDFHDSIGQNLLVIRNSMIRMRKDNIEDKHREKLKELMHITSDTLDEIRTISQNLRPTMLDSIGLTASIESMIRKLNEVVEINFKLDCPQPIDHLVQNELEINIYRILQELTNNSIKHAKAQNVAITIGKENKILLISVADDGIGFDINFKDYMHPKNGLSSIKERTNILNGKFNIDSSENKGTKVTILIPIDK